MEKRRVLGNIKPFPINPLIKQITKKEVKKKMAKKKPVHGIARAQQINAKRSPQAKRADKAKAARSQYRKATKKNIEKWKKDPQKHDMKGVDTKTKQKKKKKSSKKKKKS